MKKIFKNFFIGISIKSPILQIIVFLCLSMVIVHLSLATTLQEYREYTVVLEEETESQAVFVNFIETSDRNIDELYSDGNKALLYSNEKEYEVTLYCDITDDQQSKYYFINSPDVDLGADRIKVVSANHNLFESIINRLTRKNYEK